jgi:hypothetical protein
MTHTEKLMDFVLNLTEEQAKKLANRLPELTSLLEESIQPSPPAQCAQTE